jgi:GNAT superfamily N-acetyltransferase
MRNCCVMDIRRVDPGDRSAVQAFHEIYRAVGVSDAPETFVTSPIEEIVTVLAEPTARFEFSAFLGYSDDGPVASGWAAGCLVENADHMFVLPRVLPTERRHGYGSEMLGRLEVHAQADGRKVLDVQSRWGTEFGPTGENAPTVHFAARHGFKIGLAEVIRRLDLPLGAEHSAQVSAMVSSRAATYTVQSWIGPVPEEFLDGWAEMEAAVSRDAPTGELDFDAQAPSPEAVRDDERVLEASGQTSVHAVALDEAGEIVAYTEMVIMINAAQPARQGGTLVRASHRGNRLGLAVKSAAIDLLERERPDIPATLTQNAVVNKHMIAINDQLGYRAIEYIGHLQKRL